MPPVLGPMGLGRKALVATLSGLAGGAGATVLALERTVKADDLDLHPPSLKWPHFGPFESFDHASLRRGYSVYKQVCAACHSMKYLAYRNLIGVTHTEDEAKDEADQVQVEDGPNDEGDMFFRSGRLSDYFPSPFRNDNHAAAMNNGAVPPDLSYIVLARHGGEDYIYHLLNGYCEPPAGMALDDGQYFNPYFPGGKTGMAPPLYDEIIEYDDGTPATQSQLSKDVVNYLAWCSSPEQNDRKLMGIKFLSVVSIMTAGVFYWKRHIFSLIKSRKFVYTPRKYTQK